MMFWKEVRAMAQRGRKPKPTAVKGEKKSEYKRAEACEESTEMSCVAGR